MELTPNLLFWGSNPLRSKMRRHCSGIVAHFDFIVAHLTFVDPRWPCDISGKIGNLSPNHIYIARYRQFIRIYPEISPDRYFSMKCRVDTLWYTIFRRYIAEISRHFPPCLKLSTKELIKTKNKIWIQKWHESYFFGKYWS